MSSATSSRMVRGDALFGTQDSHASCGVDLRSEKMVRLVCEWVPRVEDHASNRNTHTLTCSLFLLHLCAEPSYSPPPYRVIV